LREGLFEGGAEGVVLLGEALEGRGLFAAGELRFGVLGELDQAIEFLSAHGLAFLGNRNTRSRAACKRFPVALEYINLRWLEPGLSEGSWIFSILSSRRSENKSMSRFRCPCLVLCGWLGFAGTLLAQQPPVVIVPKRPPSGELLPVTHRSHVPIPGFTDRNWAEQLLARRMQRARDLSDAQSLAQRIRANPRDFGLTDQDIKDLEKKFGGLTGPEGPDPDPARWGNLLDELKNKVQLEPRDRETLERAANELRPPPAITPVTPGTPPMGGTPPSPPGVGPMPPPMPPPPMPPPGITGTASENSITFRVETETEAHWLTQKFADLFKDMLNRPTSEDDFLGLSDLIKRIPGFNFDGDNPSFLTDKMLDLGKDYLPSLQSLSFERYLPDVGSFLPRNPSLPSLTFFSNGPSLPRTSGETVGNGLFFVFVAGSAVVLLMLVRRGLRVRAARLTRAIWKLGPWPLAPSAVRTRGDLVLAFEYLALLQLGRTAETANHRDIADRLEAATDPHSTAIAIQHLTDLYEQARYAPPDEELADADVQAARRELTYLAGVASA
jgi:hypothetical protein